MPYTYVIARYRMLYITPEVLRCRTVYG